MYQGGRPQLSFPDSVDTGGHVGWHDRRATVVPHPPARVGLQWNRGRRSRRHDGCAARGAAARRGRADGVVAGAASGPPPRPAARRRRRPRAAVRPHRRGAAHTERRPLDGPAPRPRRRRAPGIAADAGPLWRCAWRPTGSALAPAPVAAIVRRRIRAETRGVIIPAADPAFARHVARRTGDGFALNVNLLGEAILGDDEAAARLDALARADAPPRRRLRLGEDLGAVRQPRRARLRPRGRPHRRPPARSCTASRMQQDTPRVRQPRHGGVPRPPPDRRRRSAACSTSRRSAPCRRHRAAGVPPRHPRRARRAAALGRGAPPHRRCRRQGAPRQGRQPGDGARRRRARRLAIGAVRHQGRRRRQLQGAARPAARRRRGGWPARRRRQPQPVRRGLGAGRAGTSRARARGRRDRDARGHGAAAGPGDAGRGRRRAAVHAGRHRRGLRGQHRLPLAAPRRERRAGELPPLAVHDHARLAGVGGRAAPLRARRRRRGRRSAGSPRRCQDRRREDRRFDPDAPFANEPDTDFTQAANRAWIAAHLAADRPAPLPDLIDTAAGIDAVVGPGAARRRAMAGDVDRRTAARAQPRRRGDGRRRVAARWP